MSYTSNQRLCKKKKNSQWSKLMTWGRYTSWGEWLVIFEDIEYSIGKLKNSKAILFEHFNYDTVENVMLWLKEIINK